MISQRAGGRIHATCVERNDWALGVECPTCGAPPERKCQGRGASKSHRARWRAAALAGMKPEA